MITMWPPGHAKLLLAAGWLLLLSSCGRLVSSLSVDHGSDLFEVVGASGRMGSLWLRQAGARAVARGVAPGSLVSGRNPIVVNTPAASWEEIYQGTLPQRRLDLVWVGNGWCPNQFQETTVVVPHYGVLERGGHPVTSPNSPPTYVFGRHAAFVRDVLETKQGVQVEILDSWRQIQWAAARKLLWASALWLLCHDNNRARTVSAVHQESPHDLERLVRELLPVLLEAVLEGQNKKDEEEGTLLAESELNKTLAYMKAYSDSIADAIPDKQLALNEIQERNGFWLQYCDCHAQPFHQELLERVGGRTALSKALDATPSSSSSTSVQRIHLPEVDISVLTRPLARGVVPVVRKAVVVGAGILGCCMALNLARRGVAVTVVDRRRVLNDNEDSPPQHHNNNKVQAATTTATEASWAWLNANQKSPLHYQCLNQLGMRAWRTDELLRELPVWNGSLVQYKKEKADSLVAGYAMEGPLSIKRIEELEPQATFSLDDGPVYFFKEEGCVDPLEAARVMKEAATDLGVEFVTGCNVTDLSRNEDGAVNGIVASCTTDEEPTHMNLKADVVLVVAGIGSSAKALGGLPLLDRPGTISFADVGADGAKLTRILVDTVHERHVLQRKSTIVAGGGYLQVGGVKQEEEADAQRDIRAATPEDLLVQTASLAPRPVLSATYSHAASSVRPMPLDGLPAAGYLESSGLYTVCSHSGVTLAPVLASLVATELARGVQLAILEPFRPSRFFE